MNSLQKNGGNGLTAIIFDNPNKVSLTTTGYRLLIVSPLTMNLKAIPEEVYLFIEYSEP
jgi:hypothetical protein